jgi:hypothetical protein
MPLINPDGNTITQYNVQIGATNNLQANVAPGATGIPLISQGASANPIFGTATVPGGGTGQTTLTNHGVLVGAGTSAVTQLAAGSAGQVLQSGGASADPVYSTATYPATATSTGTILRADGTNWSATTSTYPNTNAINTLLYASSANVMSALATANNGVLTTGTSGIPVITALASDGQVIIGSSAGAPAAANITGSGGITVTNGHNTIAISNTNPSGFPWTDVTGATQTLAVNNGYITDHTNVTYTLPASAALGDTMKIVGKSGITTVAQNANQQILMSSASSTVGVSGSIAGTNVGDCVELICITAGASTVWRGASFVGNFTVT